MIVYKPLGRILMKGKLALIAAVLIISLSLSSYPTTLAIPAPTPLWHRIYGGASSDRGYSVIECSDGGFAFTGYADNETDYYEIWFVRTDADGHKLWGRSYNYGGPGSYGGEGRSIVEVSSGGFAILGNAFNTSHWENAFIIRTDVNGTQLWNQTYGMSDIDIGWSLIEVSTGGFAMVGNADNATYPSLTSTWMLRMDASGNHLWNRTFGGAGWDYCYNIIEYGGGFVFIGRTSSYGAGNSDLFLLRTDSNGVHLWNTTWGGFHHERGYDLIEVSSGGLAVIGRTVSYGSGDSDAVLIRFPSEAPVLDLLAWLPVIIIIIIAVIVLILVIWYLRRRK